MKQEQEQEPSQKSDNDDSDGFKLEDLKLLAQIGRDKKELAYYEAAQRLFDKDSIYMISRLSQDFRFYITKLIIMDMFYVEYWSACSLTTTVIESDKFPFYQVEHVYTHPDMEVLKTRLNKFIETLCELTISDGGEGRKEIIEILSPIQIETESKGRGGLRGMLGM